LIDPYAKVSIRAAYKQNRENKPDQHLSQMFKEVRAEWPANIPDADQIDKWKNTRSEIRLEQSSGLPPTRPRHSPRAGGKGQN
jgi:hypothetical protein